MARSSKLSILIIVVFGFISYFNSFYNDFVWDDRHLILENPFLHQSNIFRIFTQDLANSNFSETLFYRPLQNLSYLIDYSIWGFNPFGYHVTNTLIHTINAILIFFLIARITREKIIPLLTSLFFVSHPIHYGVVTYISGRADSLFTLFFLISFLAFIKYRESFKGRLLLISLVSLVLSLLSKEMAIIGIFVFILYDIIFRNHIRLNLKEVLYPYLAYGIPLFIYGILRLNHLRESIFATFPEGNFFVHIITFPKIAAQYLISLLIPLNLHMGKSLDLATTFSESGVVAPSLLIALIILLGFKLKERFREVSFFIFYFFIALLPVSNIIARINALVADSWLYMPSIGYCFVISYCLTKIGTVPVFSKDGSKKRGTVPIFALLLIAVYSSMTIRQNVYWKDDLTLSSKTLEYDPHHPLVRGNLGLIYLYKGEPERALEEEKKVIAFSPNYATAYYNLGVIYFKMDNFEKAKDFFKKAVEKNPVYAEPHIYLGLIYKKEGIPQDAETELRRFIKLKPYSALGYLNMGILEYEQERTDPAVTFLNTTIEKDPANTTAHLYLGTIYRKKQEFIKALEILEKAARISPEDVNILMDLGNMYNSFGQFDKAITHFKKAIIISPDNGALYYNTGTSYWLKKDPDRAGRYWRRALEIDPSFEEARDSLKELSAISHSP